VSRGLTDRASAVFHSRAAADTERLGERLAPALEPGDVVALRGPLGAGKTRLVAGIARGLGVPGRVRSPSFTLVQELHGRIPLAHLDLYRLEPHDVPGLGLDETLERAAAVVEWGERLPAELLAEALDVAIEPGSGDVRRIVATASHRRAAALLAAWRRAAAGDEERR
jgi:tRNA threonylcarbamoyladenosine biosynthesis protein TsaE